MFLSVLLVSITQIIRAAASKLSGKVVEVVLKTRKH